MNTPRISRMHIFYMRANVLLNLLNELRKRDKMKGSWVILSFFRNGFDNLTKTGARMLDSFYHVKLTFLKNRIIGVKTSIFYHCLRNVITGVIT